MRRSLACWVLLGLGSGCGDSTPVASDAGADRPPDVADVMIAADTGAVCDVGSPPVPEAMLPQMHASTIILGGDAGSTFPMASGGDPTGNWLMTGATFYLPATASGQVIPERTTITGTGWGVIEGNHYRLATNLELALETVMVGTVRRPVSTGGRGTFVQHDGDLALAPECSTQTSGMAMPMLGFSRDSMNHGRLFADLNSTLGRAVIVFELERMP